MQKKIIIILLIFISAYGCAYENHFHSSEQLNINYQKSKKWQSKIEARVGYFIFSNSKMRKVFDQGGIDIQLNGTCCMYKNIEIYGSIEYLERHGKSLEGHQKTKIQELPFNLGLKFSTLLHKNTSYYFTLGPRYFFVHVRNHSSFVDQNMRKNGLGCFANTGLNHFLCKNFLINIFGEYSYGRLHFHASKKYSYGQTAQIGGFVMGGGLGYLF